MFDLEMCAERALESAESDGCIEFVRYIFVRNALDC